MRFLSGNGSDGTGISALRWCAKRVQAVAVLGAGLEQLPHTPSAAQVKFEFKRVGHLSVCLAVPSFSDTVGGRFEA